jgi:hypothetical protein
MTVLVQAASSLTLPVNLRSNSMPTAMQNRKVASATGKKASPRWACTDSYIFVVDPVALMATASTTTKATAPRRPVATAAMVFVLKPGLVASLAPTSEVLVRAAYLMVGAFSLTPSGPKTNVTSTRVPLAVSVIVSPDSTAISTTYPRLYTRANLAVVIATRSLKQSHPPSQTQIPPYPPAK